MAMIRPALSLSLAVVVTLFGLSTRVGHASCGAVTCFVVIGSQQQVPLAGVLTVNAIYNYTPMHQMPGTTAIIPAIDVDNRQLILNHHREIRTITQTYALDLNYGITDRWAVELLLPYLERRHQHIDGLGEVNGGDGVLTRFNDNGIGDMYLAAKYNLLPSLRSMVVPSLGVYFPSGDWKQKTAGVEGAETMETTAQLGRGQFGLQVSLYQTYELIPHRLNQFASVNYRHTFRNPFGYQFGDQWDVNGGFNLVVMPRFVLTQQFNYRYLVHDSFKASLYRSATPADAPDFPGEPVLIDPTIKNRPVPTTGSTYLAYTPGFLLTLTDTVQMYFYAQIPVVRDFNDNLAQGTSFVFGITKFFSLV